MPSPTLASLCSMRTKYVLARPARAASARCDIPISARAADLSGLAPRWSKRAISAMRGVGRVIVYHQSHGLGRSNVVPAVPVGATSDRSQP